MTSGLRKIHKYSWLLLVLIIPLIMVFALKDLDVLSQKEALTATYKSPEGTVVKTSENEILKASLIKNDSLYTLEVILKKPLKQPSLVLERVHSKGVSEVIGQLSSVGLYTFEVDEAIERITLRDPLKEQALNIVTLLAL